MEKWECGIKFCTFSYIVDLVPFSTRNRSPLNLAGSPEETLRITAAWRVSSPALRRATRETKPETNVVYILVTKVPVTGRAGGRAEEGAAADSSSRRKIPEPTVPIPAAGVESDIYGCERGGRLVVYVSDV